MGVPSAVEALQVLARSEALVHRDGSASLRQFEMYTHQGLLTLHWHDPVVAPAPAAIVAFGGAMGGTLGPGHALYHRLGEEWSRRGVCVIRVGYRRPNDLDTCTHDVAAAVELAVEAGATNVVVMGHSFGGAVAVRTAVVMPEVVSGVVTFATQSAGCDVAGALAGRPFLLFHGARDELLPLQASEVVRAIAGTGELVVLPGDGHLLARSDEVIVERLDEWLPPVLGL